MSSQTNEEGRNLDQVAPAVLRLLFDAVPAEEGAIVLFECWTPEAVSVYGERRGRGPDSELPIPWELVRRVYGEGAPVLSDSEGGRRALAVPLYGCEALVGVLYLGAAMCNAPFGRAHLQFAAAMGEVAGAAVQNIRQSEWLDLERERVQIEIEPGQEMIGGSSRMRRVHRFIHKVARSDSTVLIFGESGTGKELVARAIHRSSARAGRPFVAINCAALTETLLESELFGYERGAFTGALAQKKGKLQAADGGTVFLDEIGELPLGMQAKILRAIQEREFERVGGTEPVAIDVRLIAATNRDLMTMVTEGKFRPDLYYRLNVVSMTMPPLRERREDIPQLADYFAAQCSRRVRRPVTGICPEARALLFAHDWPGNVRELENTIERAVVLGSTELIVPEDLPEAVVEAVRPSSGEPASYHDTLRRAKEAQILDILEQTGGSYVEAAKRLGLHVNYLHRLIRNLNLKPAIRKRMADQPQQQRAAS